MKKWILSGLLFAAFLFSIFNFSAIEGFLTLFITPKNIFAERTPLYEIAYMHIGVVALSSFLSILVAVALALLTKMSFMKEIRDFLLSSAIFGQTIPTVAILAILIPVFGYGVLPVLIALFIYGVLPVFRNTVEGLNTIPEEIKENAKAVGMNKMQMLLKVEIPLAMPAIIAGIRVSVILNISVATIGATVGLVGFGTLVLNGIRSQDLIMLLKGAIPVSLLALAVDSLFSQNIKNISRG